MEKFKMNKTQWLGIGLIIIIFLMGSNFNLIPKFFPFGNSTYLLDSTNYVKLNKGFYV